MTLAPTRVPGPGWLPGPGRQGAVDRETLWYDHALGDDAPVPPPWAGRPAGDEEPVPDDLVDLVARPGTARPWPSGLWGSAVATAFPAPAPAGPDAAGSVGRASLRLAAHAVAAVRRDPDDPYNDHRAYASPRCVFPVRAAVVTDGEWHVLDPDRRRVVPSGVDAGPAADEGTIALSGRWDAVPAGYGWFRGGLVALETGILLRHLAVLGRLHGLPLSVSAPGPGAGTTSARRMWRDPARWSPPWVLTPDTAAPATGGSAVSPDLPPDPWAGASAPAAGPVLHGDDAGEDLARIYGSHVLPGPRGALGTGLPDHPGTGDAGSWAEVLWRRSAGRMPRGLFGFRVADRPVDLDDARHLARWALLPPPGPLAAADAGRRVHALVRDVPGLEPGVHEVGDGTFHRRTTVPDALDRFARAYLYGSDEMSRNDIARAPLVLVTTSRPRAAVRRVGPGGWTATHVAAGWLAHGVSLAAAARRLVARPVRALDERDVAAALDLDDDEMVGLAVVVSHHAPHGGLQIDLRS